MTEKDVNRHIQQMIENPDYSEDDVIQFVRGKCQDVALQPQTLGMLFEMYAGIKYDENDPTSGFSRVIPISELKRIHPSFVTSNGCQWARSDNSYLGNKYVIIRNKVGGKVASVKLDGMNHNSVKVHRDIRSDIRKTILSQRCAILDVSTNIEIDHKNGRYSDLRNLDTTTQKVSDFQALSKAANDAKRQHCKKCIQDGKRYDARRLGYKDGWIVGDADTTTCGGCYWHDPRRFNELISKDYVKTK